MFFSRPKKSKSEEKEEESAKPNDGESKIGELPTASIADDDAASTTSQSKDLKREIRIIHELIPPGVVHEVHVDASNDESTEPGPAKQVLDHFQKTIQPIQKGFTENVQKIQGAFDENIGKRVKPHLDKANETIQGIGTSTRSLVDDHVKPGWQSISRGTVEGFHTAKRSTVKGFEDSKALLIDLPNRSKRVMDDRVIPAVQTAKKTTQDTVENVKRQTIQSYQTNVQPHVDTVNRLHTTHGEKYMGRAPALFDPNETRWYMLMLEATLRGFGRVLFCDNPVTGSFILLAMFFSSPITCLCSLTSVVSTTYCAYYLDLAPLSDLRNGAIGSNAVLVGAGSGVFLYFRHPFFGWLGSLIVAAFVMPPFTLMVYLHCTRTWFTGIPPLLIPYNIVMISFLVAAILWDRTLVLPVEMFADNNHTGYHVGIACFNAVSTVFLVRGTFCGVLILFGALLCSRILVAAMVGGSLVATLLGMFTAMPEVTFNAGIAGYNAVLTSTALAFYFEPSWTLLVVGIFSIILCELFQVAFAAFFWDALYVSKIARGI